MRSTGNVRTARLPGSPEGPAHLLASAFPSDERAAPPCGGGGSQTFCSQSSFKLLGVFFKFKDPKDLEFGFIFF